MKTLQIKSNLPEEPGSEEPEQNAALRFGVVVRNADSAFFKHFPRPRVVVAPGRVEVEQDNLCQSDRI